MKTASIILLCIVVFGVGYLLGRISDTMPYAVDAALGGSPASNEAAAESAAQTGAGGEGMTFDISHLNSGQRAMLKTFGVEGDTITITPAMVACAEAKIGAERVAAIKNGATPTFTEGATLLSCYRGN